MKWFIPSWNGDFRLEPDGDDQTLLSVHKPTPDEETVLAKLHEAFKKEGWIGGEQKLFVAGMLGRKKSHIINAPLEKVGPLVISIMKPGPAALTAVRYENGKVITCSGGRVELEELAKNIGPYRTSAEEKPPEEKLATATAAATVKRPTPSCPQCIPGAIGPASEVLLAFLNEEEHESWAKERHIVIEGGLSGHRYILAHRHSKLAQRFGRICYDMDAKTVVHFHDWTVPPEEEVLAAKLILEHREPWLRNEATLFAAPPGTLVFKNPFGDFSDGIEDSQFTTRIGRVLGVSN